jgi:DNA-binding GntR family transcriptional regulator
MSPKGMPKPNGILDIISLREQVYRYIRGEITSGKRIPGSCINLKDISSQLGISTTPLRDAIIRLECEGFVTILPRRGILVNKLSLKDIRDLVEICGMIESSVIITTFDIISPSHIKEMESLNVEMRSAISQDDFDRYYKLNIAFHGVFLDLSENQALHQIVMPIKQRLYDFPRRAYIKNWELINCDEHDQLIELIKKGEPEAAASLWKDKHWSFTYHEKFIRKFYSSASAKIRKELAVSQKRAVV